MIIRYILFADIYDHSHNIYDHSHNIYDRSHNKYDRLNDICNRSTEVTTFCTSLKKVFRKDSDEAKISCQWRQEKTTFSINLNDFKFEPWLRNGR